MTTSSRVGSRTGSKRCRTRSPSAGALAASLGWPMARPWTPSPAAGAERGVMADAVVIRHGAEILWGEPLGEDGELIWELERPDGSTERVGTLADMKDEIARVKARVAII